MYPVNLVLGKVTTNYNEICQFVDRPEVIFVLALGAILVSLGLLKIRR
jgi:hypothetical protein